MKEGQPQPVLFQERLGALLDTLDEEPNAQYFVLGGILYTYLPVDYGDVEEPGGMPMWRWIEQMVDGDPEWSSYRP